MKKGVIKVADKEGVFVIKMLGDVRLNLSLSFDEFIQRMLASEGFCSVIFDLREAEAIDSTTLGLMAKISLQGREIDCMDPIVISNQSNITRLLESMGFNAILQIVESAEIRHDEFKVLGSDVGGLDEEKVKAKVLDAHRSLIRLNSANEEAFQELIQSLENTKP